MTHPHEHSQHHHHAAGRHPPGPILPSLLRSSLAQRLALAAGMAALLWLCTWWAMG